MATERRGSARQRGYATRWDKARKRYLAAHPLCMMCRRDGRVAAADVVDHIKPHRGDMALFWDEANWQALCAPCHNSRKQQEEKLGYSRQVGEDGWPVDARHPSNTTGR